MTSKAHVKYDPMSMSVAAAVVRESGTVRQVIQWPLLAVNGHSTHDTRILRRDYEAERSRVDRLIGHLIGAH